MPGSEPGHSRGAESDERAFASLLDHRRIAVQFQPVVDLRSGHTVALEALARGPAGTPFASPLALFDAARRAGRVAELDWVCRAAAYESFLRADPPSSLSLFINTEPEGFAGRCPADLAGVVARAESVLRVFVEVNDEAIAADPAGVLAAVDRARENGWGIAIDDVGASRVPTAMLPILQADVVKLDLRLLHEAGPDDANATITSALRHVEVTGASLLVERIENDEDARWARALGAVYGQGRHLGEPAPLQAGHYSRAASPVPLVQTVASDLDIASPFAPFEGLRSRRMEPDLMERLAGLVARGPRGTESWPVFLAGLGRPAREATGSVEGLPRVPRRSLLAAAFGVDLPVEVAPGLRGVRVPVEDPLARERFLVVLTDQASLAMLARPADRGLYEVVVTQDQELVVGIAHHLIRRIPRAGHGNRALPVWRPADKVRDEDTRPTRARPGWRHRLGLG